MPEANGEHEKRAVDAGPGRRSRAAASKTSAGDAAARAYLAAIILAALIMYGGITVFSWLWG